MTVGTALFVIFIIGLFVYHRTARLSMLVAGGIALLIAAAVFGREMYLSWHPDEPVAATYNPPLQEWSDADVGIGPKPHNDRVPSTISYDDFVNGTQTSQRPPDPIDWKRVKTQSVPPYPPCPLSNDELYRRGQC
jgi:hypothetical protein